MDCTGLEKKTSQTNSCLLPQTEPHLFMDFAWYCFSVPMKNTAELQYHTQPVYICGTVFIQKNFLFFFNNSVHPFHRAFTVCHFFLLFSKCLPKTQCTGLALGTLLHASGYGYYKQMDKPESPWHHLPILYKLKCLNPDQMLFYYYYFLGKKQNKTKL